MRIGRYRPWRVFVLASAWLWPLSAHAQRPWRFGDVNFPAAIDTFVNSETFRWIGHPDLGVSLTYVIPGDEQTEFTIYVYPVRARDTLAARGDPRTERDQAAEEIRDYGKRNRQLDEVRLDSQGIRRVTLPGGQSVEGAYASFTFRRGEQRLASHVFVFVRGHQYLKIRCSVIPDGPDLSPHLQRFLAGALSQVSYDPP